MKSYWKVAVVVALCATFGGVLALKAPRGKPAVNAAPEVAAANQSAVSPAAAAPKQLPRMVDVGADKCIPCKMMAPILEELKKDYAGRVDVEFVDVWKNPSAGTQYAIQMIPTQLFFDASGKELFRHVGFFGKEEILGKWVELGMLPAEAAAKPAVAQPAGFTRLEPAAPDARPKETICYMCDGDINPKTRTVLKTDKGDVGFCSPHCYFITFTSMPENPPVVDNVFTIDWATGTMMSAGTAKFVFGIDEKQRPLVKAFADPAAATTEQQAAGGNVLEWAALQEKELATRCGFCDRAVYPEDACGVNVEGGLRTWGCCTMCALGVAARLQKDIEVAAKDALTGEAITLKTAGGHVGLLEPQTAVVWAGTKKDAEGRLASTGCFKQAFFVNEENLKKWVEAHPTATGRMIPIEQALAEKMKLTPQQISKACKIGECTPK